MWKQLIKSLEDDAVFFPPATTEQIREAETALRVKLPGELKNLLAETDGVFGKYGLGLIWPMRRIIKDNLAFRANFEPGIASKELDTLLFFADAGNGDQFAYQVGRGSVVTTDVYAWNHEDASQKTIAISLKDYLQGWLQGTISV